MSMDAKKYFKGQYNSKIKNWFIGSFLDKNHPCKTNQIEVLYIEHEKGFVEKPHFHSKKIELLLILDGKARYNINGEDITLVKGDFLFVDVNNTISGEFLEPSKIFAVHSPSIPDDKTVVD